MPDGSILRTVVAAVSGNPPPQADWMELLTAANNALVTATMAERLRESGVLESLPDDVQEFLQAVFESAVERNRRMLEQLTEAVGHLNRVGVRPLLIKGAAILADLDLLVRSSELADVVAALEAIGYAPDQEAGRAVSATALSRPKDTGAIDLHDEYHTARLRFDFESLQRGATQVRLGEGEAWLPSPTMQLVVLVAHDQLRDRDYWRGYVDIRHLFDAASIVGSAEGVDWGLLESLFPAGVPRAALRTYCRTLHGLLGTPVPGALRRGWRSGLQYRRRLLQARWPGIVLPATALSALLDPPVPPLEVIRRIWNGARHDGSDDVMFRIRRRFKGLFDSTRMGKL